MNFYSCENCGHPIFFDNTLCVKCKHTLGYLPDQDKMSALIPARQTGLWTSVASQETVGQHYRMCKNYSEANVCNWMVPADNSEPLCLACRLNRTIPDLSQPENVACWRRLEGAKRRLVYSLLRLDLPLQNKHDDPEHGLAFDFLADPDPDFSESQQVITGHAKGLITINIAEADEVIRVKMRLDMNERYRTLLGHFRHEVGHYYWQLLVSRSEHLDAFRKLYGDEQQDYGAALKTYYDQGAPEKWQNHHISAYASSHPWEDWAETWAHYLHIIDTLETAQAYGLAVTGLPLKMLSLSEFIELNSTYDESFKRLISEWLPLTFAFNAINRSMGMEDIYPFVLSGGVIDKLHFVHKIINQPHHSSNSSP
ncbi:MAG: putative zinc-binding peptidase [Desulforhopalus sp.]